MTRSDHDQWRRALLAEAAAGVIPNMPMWLPPSDVSARRVPCGCWWDAVRVPEDIGAVVLEALAGQSGPVIGDRCDGVYSWLVAPGAADGWRGGLPVQVYGVACRLLVPSLGSSHTCWVEWLVQPEPGRDCLTDPGLLNAALTAAVAGRARPESGR
ncbi:hypothetical protein ACTWP5_18255 [Streptomyces sp. 4N509B]|uniref:hypothetical protein n=1 Tax=Streptomyces sp. 4N509B TaxID=3457413 RepID=UPI003FCEF426